MLPIYLQLFAAVEYLLSSCVPGIIACTMLNAVVDLLSSKSGNSLCSYQQLLLLLFVEYAVRGVSYKLLRPREAFLFRIMQLIYVSLCWYQFSVVSTIKMVPLLLWTFTAKTLIGVAFVALSIGVQCTDVYLEHIWKYRDLLRRLYGFPADEFFGVVLPEDMLHNIGSDEAESSDDDEQEDDAEDEKDDDDQKNNNEKNNNEKEYAEDEKDDDDEKNNNEESKNHNSDDSSDDDDEDKANATDENKAGTDEQQ